LDEFDSNISQGVLNINLGPQFGNKTWVINKQTPNRQIWWSSPLSGPRRFEFEATSADSKDPNNWKFTKDRTIEIYDELKREISGLTKISLD
jgi:frataxin